MAKITRATHKVFGASGSSDNFAQFGSEVAGDPIKTKDIETIQALAAWDDGFQEAIYGANKALLLEDLNSFALEHSTQVGYILEMGVPEWDSGTTYYKGSIVQRTDGSGNGTAELYASVVDNNLNNALPVQTNNGQWTYLNPPPLPSGSSIDFMGIVVPVGFLGEDGSAVSRTTYAALWAALSVTTFGTETGSSPIITGIPDTSKLQVGFFASGTGIPSNAKILTVDSSSQVTLTLAATGSGAQTISFAPWGIGDGATTFNLPDTRRRVTVGAGGAGTATLGSVVGAVGGEETHTLTTPEIPSHTHTTTGYGNVGGTPNIVGAFNEGPAYYPASNGNTGGGGAHNNVQPSMVVTKIIKF